MVYILLFLFLSIPVIRYDLFAKKGGEEIWYWASFVLLVLVAGLRYRVGGDTLVYMSEFNMYPKLDELRYFDFETARFNPLWYIIAAFSRSIDDSFTCFQIIHAIIVNYTFFHFFRKYCPRYFFTAILVWFYGYWCYFSMEVLREVLCVCLLLWATDFLLGNKWLRYYLVCVLALFIHVSAAVMLIIPLAKILFKRPNWIVQLIILGCVVVFTLVVDIPLLITNILSLNDQLATVIENYLQADLKNLTGKLYELAKFLPVLGLLWLREKNRFEDEYDFIPYVSCMVIFYGFSSYLGVAGRFLNYFVPFFIVLLVNTMYDCILEIKWREKGFSAIVAMSVVVVLTFNYSRYYFRDSSETYPNTHAYNLFVPYHSVLNPVVDDKREGFVENLRDFAIVF